MRLHRCIGLQGDSDLQLERINVYFNEASGGASVLRFPPRSGGQPCSHARLSHACSSAFLELP